MERREKNDTNVKEQIEKKTLTSHATVLYNFFFPNLKRIKAIILLPSSLYF